MTDLVPLEEYAVMQMDPADLEEILSENLGSDDLTEFDLDRVKIPSGGATQWRVPTLEGEVETKTLDGVIIYWKNARAYWSTKFGEGDNVPDCTSTNGEYGVGDPGGDCKYCPLAQFGSAPGGGQECTQMRMLFIVRPDSLMPVVVVLPPTSIKPARQYFLRLAGAQKPYWAVVTRLTLERTKNKDGIEFSVAHPQLLKSLDGETAEHFRRLAQSMRPAFQQVAATDDDIEV